MDVFNGQSYRCILSFENRGVVCACKFNRKDQNPGLFGLKFSVCVCLKQNRVVLVVLCALPVQGHPTASGGGWDVPT